METKSSGRIILTVAIIAVICAFVALIFISLTSRPAPADQAWTAAMTTGPEDASSHYIMYTDIMCPYCTVFSREAMNHWDEFQEYLNEHKILFEIRMTDMIYEGNDVAMSRSAGEASYCAAREDKFWDFYHGALAALWDDYQSKGIGVSKSSPAITNMPEDYWLKVGQKVGLGEDFENCVNNHETLEELDRNTRRASQVAAGLPSFQFNKFSTSGFSDTWDWTYVKRMLDAGLGK